MSIQINCPKCDAVLSVPNRLLNRKVECPTCGARFVGEAPDDEPLPAAESPSKPAGPQWRMTEDRYEPGRRYDVEPHRSGLILTLGILSLVICGPLGIFAWVMGNHDLAAMREGLMDRRGEGSTQAGRICGIIACCIMMLGCVVYGLMFMIVGFGGVGRRF